MAAGFASPWPAISGALPCVGSNSAGNGTAVRIDIARRRQPQSAREHSGQIRQNVSMQVARHHHIEGPGALHKLHAGRINQLVVDAYLGEFGGNLGEHLGIHVTPIGLGVALGNQAHLCTSAALVCAVKVPRLCPPRLQPLAGANKGMANQPLGSAPGKHLQLGSHFIGRAPVQASTLIDILALAIFANHQHVDLSGARIGQILRCTGQQPGWSLAGPQAQALANLQQR